MNLQSTEEQTLLADSVARYLDKEYTFERRRSFVAGEDGYSRANWAKFAELGWLGIGIPEDHGGLGGGPVETMIVMEAFGRHLVIEPYLATVVLGAELLRRGGAKSAALLPAVARGELVLALAHSERQSRFNLADIETRATRSGGRFRLAGRKPVVVHGSGAHQIVVSARTAGGARDRDGVTLFLVPRDTAGLNLRSYRTIDGLNAAELELNDVEVEAGSILGGIDQGLPLIEQTVDRALVALAAEACGIMAVLLDATRDYLRQRRQFGVPIGSFQVLQHRLVDMFTAHHLARSLTEVAAHALADPAQDRRSVARLAAAAKAEVGRAGRLVGQEAIQLHGGMGMTDELAVGHYFKRLTMIDLAFGNGDHHRRRFAALEPAAA